ncbi:helix-turn-helix transcriptional regulator [Nocardioides sp. CPCC 205120]|uniref:helix-turn-helix transcriptional regulator n=1 Tax=Nocardioides sp. CPCC 205120 TaxID=3406462 RepID=UPI003B50A159
MRGWLAGQSDDRPASWLVGDDPLVAAALGLLHDAPAEPWTVERLARRLSVSRATLAARFSRRVGVPPMRYLAEWRMGLASEYLADPAASVAAVGRRVGYDSPFTFSVAFKRQHGVSPSAYRRTALAAG